ncbi:MAG: DUF4070 domain-containing protein [Thermodesulfobacteriota bacterium]
MKVLLVSPEYPVTFWSFKHVLGFVSKKAAYPPLGLLTVAGLLPESWSLRLVDMNVEKLRDAHIAEADLVMVGAMLVQKASALSVIERCRRQGVPVVGGGPLFTGLPDEFRPLVDHLVLDEAEITLPRFLEDLENGRPHKVYRADGFPDLSQTPLPRWDLIQIKHYASLLVQFSRGCPFNCEFCDITNMFGRKPRVKETGQILTELEAIYDLGWRESVFFVDDNFIGNKVKTKQLLSALIEWMREHDHPFTLLTEASINLADDDELIEMLVEAGFDRVFIGLETPNEASLKECQKNQNCARDLVSAINKLQHSGLQVFGGYIVGFDHDDESIFANQIKFIQESGVVTAMVGLLHAMPNTKLWQRLKQEGRLLLEATGNNSDGSLNFIPKMDPEKLVAGYRKIVRSIYSPRLYYRRISRFLEQYQPKRKKRLYPGDLKAFVRSIFYLGILGNGISQWYYWKLLLKTFLYHRRTTSEAITLMIFGHHFRKVARMV